MATVTMPYAAEELGKEAMQVSAGCLPGTGAYRARILQTNIFRTALLALHEIVESDWAPLSEEEWLDKIHDPVVGIHPDGISFEAFSLDCSTLGWVQFENSVFEAPEVCRYGCTNIDFSDQLHHYISRLTPLDHPTLSIGTAEGVELKHGSKGVRQRKIDMPDGWLLGFGEMHAGLAQADIKVPLHKADVYNLLRFIQQKTPGHVRGRALIFELIPGEQIKAHLEPYNQTLRLQNRMPQDALPEPMQIKVYGRRRLSLLQSLIPHALSGTLYLCGDSRPSYWELHLPHTRFILALSSWSARTFSGSAVERLRGPAALVDNATVQQGAMLLQETGHISRAEIALQLDISEEQALGVALSLCRQGLAVIEPQTQSIRWRPIQYLPFAELTGAGLQTSREANAEMLISEEKLRVQSTATQEGLIVATARCTGTRGDYELSATVAADGTFADAQCTCPWMRKNRDLKGGPCKHLLALRIKALQKEEQPTQARNKRQKRM